MPFYGLSVAPLIQLLRSLEAEVDQVWLADDATGGGTLENLKAWWDRVIVEGKKFGYHVNESKSWLILKRDTDLERAKLVFSSDKINFSTDGQRHLGAVLGSESFKKEYVSQKVQKWCDEISKLSEFAKSQPHAAFCAYLHCEQHKYRYIMRTIDGISDCMKPLDDIINNIFIPAVTGFAVDDSERYLLSLPISSGGLGIQVPSAMCEEQYQMSRQITAPLAMIIVAQETHLPAKALVDDGKQAARQAKVQKRQAMIEQGHSALTNNLKQIVEQTKQPGASSWLSALPLEKHNFNLNKGEFRDALALRYGKHLDDLPAVCACGSAFDPVHAMNCKKGGLVIVRHNNIRDYEAKLLSLVCKDVEIEPKLQSISNEQFSHSTDSSDNAHPDIRARGFWRMGQNSFFDVMVTNANSASQIDTGLQSILKKHEQSKKRKYNERIMHVEFGSFTPLIFSVFGSMGPETTAFHKMLAKKIADKNGEKYCHVITYIRSKLSNLALRSSLLCLRGSRSAGLPRGAPVDGVDDFEVGTVELRV